MFILCYDSLSNTYWNMHFSNQNVSSNKFKNIDNRVSQKSLFLEFLNAPTIFPWFDTYKSIMQNFRPEFHHLELPILILDSNSKNIRPKISKWNVAKSFNKWSKTSTHWDSSFDTHIALYLTESSLKPPIMPFWAK